MLTPDELATVCQRLALSEQAQKILALIRSSPPARRVGSGGKNVPVRYPSRKMGVVIQAESRTVEFAGIYLMEHDATVFDHHPDLWKLERRLPHRLCKRLLIDKRADIL